MRSTHVQPGRLTVLEPAHEDVETHGVFSSPRSRRVKDDDLPQFVQFRSRVRIAWTSLVMRWVLQRSLRSRRQVFRGAMACSPRPDARVGDVDGLVTCGQSLPPAAEGHPDGVAGALVALVRPAGQVDVGKGIEDAVAAGRLDVVDGAEPVETRGAWHTQVIPLHRTDRGIMLCESKFTGVDVNMVRVRKGKGESIARLPRHPSADGVSGFPYRSRAAQRAPRLRTQKRVRIRSPAPIPL